MNGIGANRPANLPDLMAFLSHELRPPAVCTSDAAPILAAERLHFSATEGVRDWTRKICRGDEEAFNQFYEQYSLRIYKYLLVLSRGNEMEARETVQTVVLKVAKCFKVFDDETRLWAWLCRLSRNAFVDLCRVRIRDQRLVALNDQVAEPQPVDGAPVRMAEAMNQALDELTVEERELLSSAYVDERPLQELANEAQITYKAIESRLGRLRLKAKTSLLKHLRHEENC